MGGRGGVRIPADGEDGAGSVDRSAADVDRQGTEQQEKRRQVQSKEAEEEGDHVLLDLSLDVMSSLVSGEQSIAVPSASNESKWKAYNRQSSARRTLCRWSAVRTDDEQYRTCMH